MAFCGFYLPPWEKGVTLCIYVSHHTRYEVDILKFILLSHFLTCYIDIYVLLSVCIDLVM